VSAPATPLGYSLYFIDVLACLLFCITLALAGARFGHEDSVAIELPDLDRSGATGSALDAPSISVKGEGEGLELFYRGERIVMGALERELQRDPPLSIVVRAEATGLSRVIALAHAAGVADIRIAYEISLESGEER
jgi:hypothetical protein